MTSKKGVFQNRFEWIFAERMIQRYLSRNSKAKETYGTDYGSLRQVARSVFSQQQLLQGINGIQVFYPSSVDSEI